MDNEIRPMEPKGFEQYHPTIPEIDQTGVDVPMCKNPINDTVHWFDLTKLFVRESAITKILTMKKGITDMKDLKTTISGVVAIGAQIAKLFGVEISPELLNAVSMIAVAIGLYFAKDKTPAEPAK